MSRTTNIRKLAVMALLVAVSVVLIYAVHFPLIPAAAFLEYDPADIPILIGALAYGPLAGVALTVVASLIQGVTVSAGSGLYGIVMHIIATSTLVLVAGSIYRFRRTRSGGVLGLLLGTLAMGLIMMPANHIITPYFTGWPVEAVDALLLPGIFPFNLIKAGLNAGVTFLLYKTVSRYIVHGEGWQKPAAQKVRSATSHNTAAGLPAAVFSQLFRTFVLIFHDTPVFVTLFLPPQTGWAVRETGSRSLPR